jgi:hypothetical protein
VSSLWTPSGEYRPREEPPGPGPGVTPPGPATGPAPPGPSSPGGPGPGAPTAEEIEAVRQVQAQIRATPAAAIVANHVVQLFELALVYLGVATPPDEQGRIPAPDLAQAGVAVDAMTALIDGLGPRYGEDEATLRDALAQIQMIYVQVADALAEATGERAPDQ